MTSEEFKHACTLSGLNHNVQILEPGQAGSRLKRVIQSSVLSWVGVLSHFAYLIWLDSHTLKLSMCCTLTKGERMLRKKTKSTVTILNIYLGPAQLMFERKKKLLLL